MTDPDAERRRVLSLSLPEVRAELLRLLLDYEGWAEDWKWSLPESANRVNRHAELDPEVRREPGYIAAIVTVTMVDQPDCIETVTRHLNYLRRYLGGGEAETPDGDFPYGNPSGEVDWPIAEEAK